MIPISRHSAALLDDRGELLAEPITASLTLDADWTPRAQAKAMLLAGDSDNLARRRVTLRLRQSFGSDLSCAGITAVWGGGVGAFTRGKVRAARDVTRELTTPYNPFEYTNPLTLGTTLWGGSIAAVTADPGAQLAELTRVMRVPGGSYSPPAAVFVDYVLVPSRIPADARTQAVEVTFNSVDVELHDYRRTTTTVYVSAYTSLRELVVMAAGLTGLTLAPGQDKTIPTGAEWRPGMTIWEFLHPVLESVGWQLYGNEIGTLTLEPETPVDSPMTLHADTNLIEYEPELDQDDAYADGAIVEYLGGENGPVYDVYRPAGSRRILHETRDVAYPGPGAAELLVQRSRTRSATAKTEHLSDYRARPNTNTTVTPNDGGPRSGLITKLEWSYPEATQRTDLRNITHQ